MTRNTTEQLLWNLKQFWVLYRYTENWCSCRRNSIVVGLVIAPLQLEVVLFRLKAVVDLGSADGNLHFAAHDLHVHLLLRSLVAS